ncbi:hypothetical protein [Clostridium intestinale]|uniref:asparagine synthase (glutamine-hydrolyzing) n=1 Tax=Clostridium intestinale DSM 6191 TaxID=1121320 RepID=A0A1M6DL15_9CLOT|nr:hypothetical protein [Clostridium intestinale]SHI73719.1 asparagine synthase (glutamine-hydrolysing) [Clostridium intestinale DSM 6191]
MPGIYGVINSRNFDLTDIKETGNDNIEHKDYMIGKTSIKKFENDKVFFDNDEFSIIIDGVVLNLQELRNKYTASSWPNTIIKMYKQIGEQFMDSFRGAFSGILCDKINNTFIIFTNHYGDKGIFYTVLEDKVVFSYDLKMVKDILKKNDVGTSFNINAAYELLTYGFMIEDNTIIDKIKRLTAGKYIKINNGKIAVNSFYELNNNIINNLSEEKLIDSFDELFRYSVKLEFDKDIEYGYSHLAGLSGGLDSRMTTWVANDLGYKNITNYTFSKSNYLDYKVAQEIAIKLGNKFIFKSLDDLRYLEDIDLVIKNNGGTGCASGHIHGRSFLELINFDKFGLIHTGQLGDVVVGTFSSKKEHTKPSINDGTYSNLLIDRVNWIELDRYKNEEIFKMYNRGFNGALNSHITMQNYSEVSSPFILKEFMDLCLSIDPKIRFNHNVYYNWILTKYPEAAKYTYEKYRVSIDSFIFKNKLFYLMLKRIPKKLKNKNNEILFKLGFRESKYSNDDMNPFQYWYDTDYNMRKNISNYFEQNLSCIDEFSNLNNDIVWMFNNSLAREKIQILSLLSAYKYMFIEDSNK